MVQTPKVYLFAKHGECPLLAQSGHRDRAEPFPLSGVKRTSANLPRMSAYDPKRTSALLLFRAAL
jgi:hypothetical protein